MHPICVNGIAHELGNMINLRERRACHRLVDERRHPLARPCEQGAEGEAALGRRQAWAVISMPARAAAG